MKAPTVITVNQMLSYWVAAGVRYNEIEPRDQTYACVDRGHMLGAHYDSVARLLWDLNLSYDDDWDCEEFTMTYVWWAIIAHRRAQREAGEFFAHTPAVFECWVVGIEHAIVACLEWVDGRLQHFFVEPQPNAASRVVDLPASQIITISLIK